MKIKELPHAPKSGTGKVLALKEGYNPNSSSLGSIVFSFPKALVWVPTVTATVVATLVTYYLNKKEK